MSSLDDKYKVIIRNSVMAAAASGAIPFTDVVIMSGVWGSMIVAIAAKAGHPLSPERATKFGGAILTSILTFNVGTKIFTKVLWFFPGIGTITAMGIDSFINAFQTFRLGRQFAQELDRTNFNTSDIMTLVSHLVKVVIDLHPAHVWNDAREVISLLTGN